METVALRKHGLRIGLVTPSTNTTLEPEFYRMIPEGVTVHAARVFQSGAQEQSSYERMAADIETASHYLATAEVDVIAFGCTSCTYFVDPAPIRATMARETGAPSVLTADAVVDALRHLGLKRIGLTGPRTEFVTRREVQFLLDNGFEVPAWKCLGMGATDASRRSIGRVPPDEVRTLARAVAETGVDSIFVSCTQLPTATLIAELEDTLGIPVVTSNQATLWACLRACGVTEPIRGFGRLLEDMTHHREVQFQS